MCHDSTHSQFRTVASINSLVGFQLYLLWAIPTFHWEDLAVDACIISRVVTNHRLTPECFKNGCFIVTKMPQHVCQY